MNIVLIVFDSLRKDCLGAYGSSPPWGKVHTPHLDAFARESLTFTRVFPESLPTLPTRRALYTGQRVYPFFNGEFRLKGDFFGAAAGWGPIREDQDTLSELLRDQAGYRTALIGDVYHMFKPSKNFARGFEQWMFLRGKETDPYRSGPEPTQEEIDYWYVPEVREIAQPKRNLFFIRQCLMNMYGREREEDYFVSRLMIEAATWLEQNQDAEKFFLVLESFDPHEPWFVPEHYRRMYDEVDNGREQVVSPYCAADLLPPDLLRRAQANYSGLVTMCDRWFGHLYEAMRVLDLLDNTIIVVTTDHGHSIGDHNYIGKRGYPSDRAVFDVPLFVRHPEGIGAGERSDLLLQHTDMTAQILEFAGVQPAQKLHGKPFWEAALSGGEPIRDHVTVGWNAAITVINDRWWMNCKVDGSGALLYDLKAERPFDENVADAHPEATQQMFTWGVEDAGGEFPDFVLERAARRDDAPGCSELALRV